MLTAVILAAGASTRMGSPKALLQAPDGRPFAARIVRSLLSAGLERIVVVTGAAHDAIVASIDQDGPPVRPVFAQNPNPARGQLSSLWIGMDAAIDERTDGLLVTLVDVPMVEVSTIEAVIDAWRMTRAPIVRPAIGERHGHPVVFDCALFPELRGAPIEAGAKAVVRAYERRLVNVPVGDEGCLVDVDTRQDYEELTRVKSRIPHSKT